MVAIALFAARRHGYCQRIIKSSKISKKLSHGMFNPLDIELI
jgi:hypothetical protein